MAYVALYRRWRPQRFEDLVGQEPIVRTLLNQLESGRIAHAYLFAGPRGTGKTSTAKLFARAINCQNPKEGEPCGKCEACLAAGADENMDIIEIDAASNNGVDNIRDIRDKVVFAPAVGKYKVYIIDEVHMLSGGAFNALLKTLEEPPKHAVFILATTEIHKLPATILSRCQRFDGGSPPQPCLGPQRWRTGPSSAGFCPPGRRCPQNLGAFAPLSQSFFSLKKSWAPAASRTGCHLPVAPRRRRQDEIMS